MMLARRTIGWKITASGITLLSKQELE